MSTKSQAGYHSNYQNFIDEDTQIIIERLKEYVPDAGDGQIKAWIDSIEILKQTGEKIKHLSNKVFEDTSIILEYTIPLEERRIDAILLMGGNVIVIEFKGRDFAMQADIDQASAYARDLIAYHKVCDQVQMKCVLLLTNYQGQLQHNHFVDILGPHDLPSYLTSRIQENETPKVEDFLSFEAYKPLPSLIKAARELFESGKLTRIHRAATATEPTLDECSRIVHQTAKNKRHSLILITGVPGAGKTLVGLQLAYAQYLDDLAIERKNGEKPTAPAVFLSGNGPLVEVLQYELESDNGHGKAFVKHIKSYVNEFTNDCNNIPPHHVLIFDEAQRAFDAEKVKTTHENLANDFQGLSEPELFIKFAERVPEWSVIIGLIGTGQEIHVGEEGGIRQWKTAIEKSCNPKAWDIFIPETDEIINKLGELDNVKISNALELKSTIRFHLATQLHEYVECILEGDFEHAEIISKDLEKNGFHLRITKDLNKAITYLHDRYSNNPDARYGIIYSSRFSNPEANIKSDDGIKYGWKWSTSENETNFYIKRFTGISKTSVECKNFNIPADEFDIQGLELDACLLIWGKDFIRENGKWTNKYSMKYDAKNARLVKNAFKLRKNTYRVLLTRGRDGCVVFVPTIKYKKYKMEETYRYLKSCGFKVLG